MVDGERNTNLNKQKQKEKKQNRKPVSLEGCKTMVKQNHFSNHNFSRRKNAISWRMHSIATGFAVAITKWPIKIFAIILNNNGLENAKPQSDCSAFGVCSVPSSQNFHCTSDRFKRRNLYYAHTFMWNKHSLFSFLYTMAFGAKALSNGAHCPCIRYVWTFICCFCVHVHALHCEKTFFWRCS